MEKTRSKASEQTKTPTKDGDLHVTLPERKTTGTVPPLSRAALQQLHWSNVGIIRNKEDLTTAANTLAAWQKVLPEPTDRPSYEMQYLVSCGRLMTEAALMREESRGAHFRTDFPQRSKEWQRHLVFRKEEKTTTAKTTSKGA